MPKKIQDSLIVLKTLAKLNGKDILPSVKIPIKRALRRKETKPREQPERLLRLEVIKYLRSKGAKIYRIENSLPGYSGLPDLLVFKSAWSLNNNKMYFIELKSLVGTLKFEQNAFKVMCDWSGINHIVARSVQDVEVIYQQENKI